MKNILFSLFIAMLMIGSVLAINPVRPIIGGDGGTTSTEGEVDRNAIVTDVGSETYGRSTVLPVENPAFNNNFGITKLSVSPTTVAIGKDVTITLNVWNKDLFSGQKYVQCSILDRTKDTWIPLQGWSRTLAADAPTEITNLVTTCVPNEPFTKIKRVVLIGGGTTQLTYSINAPNYPVGDDIVVYCEAFERCAADGVPEGSATAVQKITLTQAVTPAECTTGQRRCVTGTTDKYNICIDGKWSAANSCAPGICQTADGSCKTQKTCTDVCSFGEVKCNGQYSYYPCISDGKGCKIYNPTAIPTANNEKCVNNKLDYYTPVCPNQKCTSTDQIKCITDNSQYGFGLYYTKCVKGEDGCYFWNPESTKFIAVPTTQKCVVNGDPNDKLVDIDALTCYSCNKNDIVVSKSAIVPRQQTFWELLTGTSSRTADPPKCEDTLGKFTVSPQACVNGKAIPDIRYFKPAITRFDALDCKSKKYVDVAQADLTCYKAGDSANKVPVIVTIENQAEKPQMETPKGVIAFVKQQTTAIAGLFLKGKTDNAVEGWAIDAIAKFGYFLTNGAKSGVSYDSAKGDFNAQVINSMGGELIYARVEIGLYSPEAYSTYFTSRGSALGRSGVFQAEDLYVVPSCKATSGGRQEDSYEYMTSFKILLTPKVGGVCSDAYSNTGSLSDWWEKYNGACKYTIKTELKIPAAGDKIGLDSKDNVDAQGKYVLQASVFDRCWESDMNNPASGNRPTVSFDRHVEVQTTPLSSVCCVTGGKKEYLTQTACTSQGGLVQSNEVCAGGSTTTTCYRCGKYGVESLPLSGQVTCGQGAAVSYDYSSLQAATTGCKVDPTKARWCYNCVDNQLKALYAEGTCGVEPPFGSLPYSTPPSCGGVTFKTCYVCDDKAAEGFRSNPAVDSTATCPNEFPKTQEEFDAGVCNSAAPSVRVIQDPSNELNYCIQLRGQPAQDACKRGSFERKDLVEINELDNLDEASYWDKISATLSSPLVTLPPPLITDPSIPICAEEWGDIQCKEGGICLQAKKGTQGKDENKIYDAILTTVKLDPTPWNGVIQYVVSNLKTQWGVFWGIDIEKQYVEQFGMCVHKERGIQDVAKRWFANLFGLDINDKYLNYYFFGAIGAVLVILYLLLTPRRPRQAYNPGGGF